jgi:hypothetical protein
MLHEHDDYDDDDDDDAVFYFHLPRVFIPKHTSPWLCPD